MPKIKKIAAIILARTNSTRLNNKMLLPFGESTVVETVIERIKHSKLVDTFILATSVNPRDKVFEKIAKKHQIRFIQGREEDVVSRMLLAAKAIKPLPDIIVRVCSDNPLLMPDIVDNGILELIESQSDIISPFRFNTYPFGYSMVSMTRNCLEKIDKYATESKYREHVENYCFDHPSDFKILYQKAPENLHFKELSLTLDYEEDYEKLKLFYSFLKGVPMEKQAEILIRIAKEKRVGIAGESQDLSGKTHSMPAITML